MTFLVSDLLISIKNGYVARLRFVYAKYSKLNIRICKLLYAEGFINGFFITKQGQLIIKLKYYQNGSLFKQLKILSKPSKRLYMSVAELKKYSFAKFFIIVSTTKGLLSHKSAITLNKGGELICLLSFN